ncbi:MAG: FHA domain-containing protein [Candidatus Obscuribacterales bacterium]|nr:FHA domain-containing protein [Candidatus Obscuribacterales bacterium]
MRLIPGASISNAFKIENDTEKPKLQVKKQKHQKVEGRIRILLLELHGETKKEAILELERRLQRLERSWIQDFALEKERLEQVKAEILDAESELSGLRLHYGLEAQILAQQDLSRQKGWWRKSVEVQLESIEKALSERFEAREKNREHPQGRAKARLERLKLESSMLRTKIESHCQSRLNDLQKELLQIIEKHKWPAFRVRLRESDEHSGAIYEFAKGLIQIPAIRILKEKGDGLSAILLRQMPAALDDAALLGLCLQKQLGNKIKAADLYEESTGRRPDPQFLESIKQNTKAQNFSSKSTQRLKDLAQSLKNISPGSLYQSEKLYQQIIFIENRKRRFQRQDSSKALEVFFSFLNPDDPNPEFEEALFAGRVPKQILESLEHWQVDSYNASQTERKRIEGKVMAAIDFELEQARAEYIEIKEIYEDHLGEVYASYFKEIESLENPDLTESLIPSEAARALDASALKEGDSLHANSPGFQLIRKMYEHKLQCAFMSPMETRKVLALPGKVRLQIESLLFSDDISSSALSALLKLEPKKISELLSLPPYVFTECIAPALSQGLLGALELNKVMVLSDAAKELVLSFLKKTMNDSSGALSVEAFTRFVELPEPDILRFESALREEAGSKGLSAKALSMALSAPTRAHLGLEHSDAATLAAALRDEIISMDELEQFSKLDELARSGLAILLESGALKQETAASLFEKLKTNEWKSTQVRDLAIAGQAGWLKNETLEEIFLMDAPLRNALFDRLAVETRLLKNSKFSIQSFLERMKPLNQMRKMGVISEASLRLLANQQKQDQDFLDFINEQAARAVSVRIYAESIQHMLLQFRSGRMTSEVLNIYRNAFNNGILNRNTIKTVLVQRPEIRLAAEELMNSAPEQFADLLKQGKVSQTAQLLKELRKAGEAPNPPRSQNAIELNEFPCSEESEEDSSAELIDDETLDLKIRKLAENNFKNISSGYSQLEFSNGMQLRIEMDSRRFEQLKQAYLRFMSDLKAAFQIEDEKRLENMRALAKSFELEFSAYFKRAGIELRYGRKSELKLFFDLELESSYRIPGDPEEGNELDLNLQQGLRQLLLLHPQGKQIYRDLIAVKGSAITPKFDPAPPGRRPAEINQEDQRPLSKAQRSALSFCILNDNTAALRGLFKIRESEHPKVELKVELKRLNEVNAESEVFARAELWSELMFWLNDKCPLSQTGKRLAELFESGAFMDIEGKKENLLAASDFLYILQEIGLEPPTELWLTENLHRQEINWRLQKFSSGPKLETAETETEDEPASNINSFKEGDCVVYNGEAYKVMHSDESIGRLLLSYIEQVRESKPADAKYISESKLKNGYETIFAENNILYRSKKYSDSSVYVLSDADNGMKVLHTDSSLKLLSTERVFHGQSRNKEQQAHDLLQSIRRLFDESRDFGITLNSQIIQSNEKQILLGTSDDALLKISEEISFVSKRHLQLLIFKKQVLLQDLNSKEGSYLNQRKVKAYESIPLRSSDTVNAGDPGGPQLKIYMKARENQSMPDYRILIGGKALSPQKALTIGRLCSCDAFVSDPTVSRIQATVRMDKNGKAFIKDGGEHGPSRHGTMYNGELLIPGTEKELRPGARISTRTGIELPISYEPGKHLYIESNANFLFACKEDVVVKSLARKNRSQGKIFADVNAMQGVYAFSSSALRQCIFKTPERNSFPKNELVFKAKASQNEPQTELSEQHRQIVEQALRGKRLLFAQGELSVGALIQSNSFAASHPVSGRILDSFSIAGKGRYFELDGFYYANNRAATTINRKEDQILKSIINDAQRRFGSLPPEQRAAYLNDYVRELFSPKDLSPEQLDQWYDQFCQDHAGKRILLGQFIKEGKGVSTQQALLLKVLADSFDDLPCSLIRGMDGSHCWTLISFESNQVIHDPRAQFISPVYGRDEALAQARFWIPDQTDELESEKPSRSLPALGEQIYFDGTSAWKLRAFKSESSELLLATNGTRSISGAELALLNPAQGLRLGQKYKISKTKDEFWTFQSINKDGSLRFSKADAIQVRAFLEQIRVRSHKKNADQRAGRVQ